MNTFKKYGLDWPKGTDELQVELGMIRRGGKSPSTPEGLSLFDHFMLARKLCWPRRYRHRWTDLLHGEFVKNDITIMMGAASTQKTSHASEFALLSYWARPYNTLVIVSTITMEKLETGVWGEIKMLFRMARERWDWLPGNMVEGKKAIATDDVEEDIRDLRRGLIGKPCFIGGRWVGLGTLAGIKQDYIVYVCDELQFMVETFLASWPNMFSNGNVKILGSGNPKHDPYDQLGMAAEPRLGWTAIGVPDRTQVWDTKFMNGRCVNLVGTDSPNFDTPEGEPQPYPKLIGRRFAQRIANDYGTDSPQYHTQVRGVMRIDFAQARVITRQLCKEHHATEKAQWNSDDRTKIFGIDPCYGGDDRCVGVLLEFGEGADGTQLISVVAVLIAKLKMDPEKSFEDQISDWVSLQMQAWGVPDQNCFYDSTGKGTLGFAFSRKFGVLQPIPVDSGAMPTERYVRENLYVIDQGTKRQRLKTCREHYSKFVSELWFSCRYAIEGNQVRDLPDDVLTEGCARTYEIVAGNKIQVEPKSDPKKKEDLKRRLGKSPDLFDAFAIGIEGARQRGFSIGGLGPVHEADDLDESPDNAEAREYQEEIQKQLLDHAV